MRLELPSTSAQVDYFTTNGTWTMPPGAKIIQVLLIGGGGGGGTGRRGAATTNRYGGGGGQGGFLSMGTYPADIMPETVDVTVGAGGPGYAGVTTDNTDGSLGDDGFETRFGTFLVAGGGAAGDGGKVTSTAMTANTGRGQFAGGTGAGTGKGFPSTYAGGGGGSGGHIDSGAAYGSQGWLGAGCGSVPSTYINDNRDGLGTAGAAPGIASNVVGNAVKGADSPLGVPGSGSPGGAGGNDSTTPYGAAGGSGADGCLYGGGGGGGGGSHNGYPSGASGAGGNGIAMVTTYF
jgi:hypothetical protein